MGPLKHLTCGAILATGILIKDREFDTALAAIAGAVICDTDHLLEYYKYCKDYDVKNPSFDEWKSGEYFNTKGTIYVLFHSWEVCIIMWFLLLFGNKSHIFKGLTVGYTSHLCLDQIGNNLNNKSYFWLYRWWHDWKQQELM